MLYIRSRMVYNNGRTYNDAILFLGFIERLLAQVSIQSIPDFLCPYVKPLQRNGGAQFLLDKRLGLGGGQ